MEGKIIKEQKKWSLKHQTKIMKIQEIDLNMQCQKGEAVYRDRTLLARLMCLCNSSFSDRFSDKLLSWN